MARVRTRKPTHPGVVFKSAALDPLGLSLTVAAEAMGVSRKHLSQFVNERVPCSKDLAQRIAKATGTSVASWLNMQTALDVWEAEHSENDRLAAVRPLREVAHATA
jgi:addiction module HigA family antidote